MTTQKYVYWQEEDMWLGYLEEYPDYWTQGESLEELQENLKDIFQELTSGNIPWRTSRGRLAARRVKGKTGLPSAEGLSILP